MRKFNVKVNGNDYQVEVEEIGGGQAQIVPVSAPQAAPVAAPAAAPAKVEVPSGGTQLTSPMPGTVLSIAVNNGDVVKKNQVILVLEAMKMENEITAPKDGVVTVVVSKGASVESGTVLATIA